MRRALHALGDGDARAMSLRVDTFRGATATRVASVRERLDALATTLPAHDVAAAHALLDAPPAAHDGAVRVPIHGDVYARHLVLHGVVPDREPKLDAILDWGDVSL